MRKLITRKKTSVTGEYTGNTEITQVFLQLFKHALLVIKFSSMIILEQRREAPPELCAAAFNMVQNFSLGRQHTHRRRWGARKKATHVQTRGVREQNCMPPVIATKEEGGVTGLCQR